MANSKKSKKIVDEKELEEKIEKTKKQVDKIAKDVAKTAKKTSKEVIKEAEEFADKTKEVLNDVEDKSKSYTSKEKRNGRALGMVCYLIPPIPYFFEEENKFVKFHARQGMDLLFFAIVFGIIANFVSSIIKVKVTCASLGLLTYKEYCSVTPEWVTYPLNVLAWVFVIYSVVGIIYVLQGKAKELPIINKFKIFK